MAPGEYHRPPTFSLLSGGLQPPAFHSHPCFLVPACLHPPPPLPVYLGLGDVSLPKPCQPLSGSPSFPQDHPTPGRDDPGDGVAEGGLCGVGDTHMGVSFTAARSHRHLPQSRPPRRGDRCWRAPGTDGHSRLRVHQAAAGEHHWRVTPAQPHITLTPPQPSQLSPCCPSHHATCPPLLPNNWRGAGCPGVPVPHPLGWPPSYLAQPRWRWPQAGSACPP